MATFDVHVRLDRFIQVEADSVKEAEELAWSYDDFDGHTEVYSIKATEADEDEEVED